MPDPEYIATQNLFGEAATLLRCGEWVCRQWAPFVISCGCCRKVLCADCYRRHEEARG